MSRNWIEFLISLFVVITSFNAMLQIARKGQNEAVIGYFLYMFILVFVLVVLCFIL